MPRLTVALRLTDCSTATAETAAHEVWPSPTRWARMPAAAAATATRIASGRNGCRRVESTPGGAQPGRLLTEQLHAGDLVGLVVGHRHLGEADGTAQPCGELAQLVLGARGRPVAGDRRRAATSRIAVSAWATSASSRARRLVLLPPSDGLPGALDRHGGAVPGPRLDGGADTGGAGRRGLQGAGD